MIEALETLLKDLSTHFDKFGIAYQSGQEFPLEESGLTQLDDSTQAFYDPEHCDGIKDNTQLQEIIAAAEQPWIDANQHEYRKNAGRALWNVATRGLAMAKAPSLTTVAQDLKFIEDNYRYLDCTVVKKLGVTTDERTKTRAPLVIDPYTLAFAQALKKYIEVMTQNADPFADVKANCWVPGSSKKIDQGIPEFKARLKTTEQVLEERIALYKARRNEFCSSDLTQVLATRVEELKNPALDAIKKYSDYFNLYKQIEHEISTDAEKEVSKSYLEEKIGALKKLANHAITPAMIEADINELTFLKSNVGKEPIYLVGAQNYQEPLYRSEVQAADVIKRHNDPDSLKENYSDVRVEYDSSIKTLTHFKNNLSAAEKDQRATLENLERLLAQQQNDAISITEAEIATTKKQIKQLSENLIASLKTAKNQIEISALNITPELFMELARLLHWDEEKQEEMLDIIQPTSAENENLLNNAYSVVSNSFSYYLGDYASSFSTQFQIKKDQLLKELDDRLAHFPNGYENEFSALEQSLDEKKRELEMLKTVNKLIIQLDDEITAISQALQAAYTAKNVPQLKDIISTANRRIDEIKSQYIDSTDFREDPSERLMKLQKSFDKKYLLLRADLRELSLNENPQPISASKDKEEMDSINDDNNKMSADWELARKLVLSSEHFNSVTTADQLENTAMSEFIEAKRAIFQLDDENLKSSMLAMMRELVKDYQLTPSGSNSDSKVIARNKTILSLVGGLKTAANCFSDPLSTIDAKNTALNNFTGLCDQKVYSNKLRILAGVVIGILTALVIAACFVTGIGAILGAGWLGFLALSIGANIGVAAGSATLGGIVGGFVGANTGDKSSQLYQKKMSFFANPVVTAMAKVNSPILAEENPRAESGNSQDNPIYLEPSY